MSRKCCIFAVTLNQYTMKGVIYISVSLYLEQDQDQETIDDILSEVDYSFNHPLISETRINGEIE